VKLKVPVIGHFPSTSEDYPNPNNNSNSLEHLRQSPEPKDYQSFLMIADITQSLPMTFEHFWKVLYWNCIGIPNTRCSLPKETMCGLP